MGRQWFPLLDRSPAQMRAGADAAAPLLGGFVDAELARLGLPPGAYALMGFSQGAMTALHTGLHLAVPPRGILAFSGALLAPDRLSSDRLAAAPARPAVLLVHGEADEVVPAARSREAELALTAAGFAVETLYSPRLGHGIDEAGLSAGALFLQRCFTI